MLVSLALEGKFVADGIQALEDDDDILTSMARDLVTQRGVGERAEAIWKELQAQRPAGIIEPASAVEQAKVIDPTVYDPGPSELIVPSPEAIPSVTLQTLAQFGIATRRTPRRPVYQNEDQLSLGF